ncbi:MAG TPA: RsmE family RNA methyltransferase, partial [Opitutales bacterium]|nr:RsmE family RNA methyltransferase [Opitutales bacterium]
MLRVFHPGPWSAVGGEIALDSTESSHLVRVRRARLGEVVEVLDGQGGVAAGSLTVAESRAARVKIEKLTRHPAPAPRVLLVGLPKGDVFTEIVRQATELGATAIQPLLTNRTEVNWDPTRAGHKLDRWRATALEACKQSGNPWLPQIHAPVELVKWLKTLSAENKNAVHFVAALTPDAKSIRELSPLGSSAPLLLCPSVIAIGPEG